MRVREGAWRQHHYMIPRFCAIRGVLGPHVRSNVYYDRFLVYGCSNLQWDRLLVGMTRISQQEMVMGTPF